MLRLLGGNKQREREDKETFERGVDHGYERGLIKGMQLHTTMTSELSPDETRLVQEFLIRNNFVLCYDPTGSGFILRKNDMINPKPDEKIATNIASEQVSILDDNASEQLNIVMMSRVERELFDLKVDRWESEERRKQKEREEEKKRGYCNSYPTPIIPAIVPIIF